MLDSGFAKTVGGMKLLKRKKKRKVRRSIREYFTPCDICGIGLGTSRQNNKRYKHASKAYVVTHRKEEYTVCFDCQDKVKGHKAKTKRVDKLDKQYLREVINDIRGNS